MKKLLFVAVATFGFAFSGVAQEIKWGVKAGLDLATIKVKHSAGLDLGDIDLDEWDIDMPSGSTSTSETGFFVGGFAEFSLSDKFNLQPEFLYVSLPNDASFISVPVLFKYGIAEQFHLMAGPSFNYFLNAKEDEFKFNVDFGGSYDINENIDVNAKYSLGFGDIAVSGLFIGVGYKF